MAIKRKTGAHVTVSTVGDEIVKAFVPFPLPPEPPLDASFELEKLFERANLALGKLAGLGDILPDVSLIIYNYVRREAVLSSQIEGTQSSLSDLLLYENDQMPGVPVDDVREVSNYVEALYYGMERIDNEFPISLRLMREMHEILLKGGRGSEKQPGHFRRSQNWIGGSRPGTAKYIPPPPAEMLNCLGALEKFLHGDPVDTTLLKKLAYFHVQFETIHPFLDGNGRLGRLFIPLLLYAEGVLKAPVLYLSLYFKENREEYYERLQRVRTHGEWEEWVSFFLEGIIDTARKGIELAQSLLALFKHDHEFIKNKLGRSAGTAQRVLHRMQKKPFISISDAADQCGISNPTAGNALNNLVSIGLLKELTGRKRGKLYFYSKYLHLLNEGTEPLPRG